MFAIYAEMRSPKQLQGKWKRVAVFRWINTLERLFWFLFLRLLRDLGMGFVVHDRKQSQLTTNKLGDVMNETASPEINYKFTVNSVKLRQWSVQLNLGFSLITPILFIDPAVPSSSSALSILRASFLSRNSLSGMRLTRPSNPSRRLDLSLLLESSL